MTAARILRDPTRPPTTAPRLALYWATLGRVNLGPTRAEQRLRELTARAETPVRDHVRVAVMSVKGGSGKTTTTVCLGSVLATVRGDRVVAVDANPDRGTLGERVARETRATVRDLIRAVERGQIQRYSDVRAYTSQSRARLEVIASDTDPEQSVAFRSPHYQIAAETIEKFYDLCLTDTGTGLLGHALSGPGGVLEKAHQIVLVAGPSMDEVRSASATLDWLEAHDFGGLVNSCVVALTRIPTKGPVNVDLESVERHFRTRVADVVRIPHDAHLAQGSVIDIEQTAPRTRAAFLELAAAVATQF